jgi:hypothetical protein
MCRSRLELNPFRIQAKSLIALAKLLAINTADAKVHNLSAGLICPLEETFAES